MTTHRARGLDVPTLGPKHALLSEFRRAFAAGLVATPGRTLPRLAIEGPRMIGEAIRCGLRIDTLLFSRTGLEHHGDKLLPQLSKHTTTAVAADAAFRSSMDVEHPQGVAALVRLATSTLEEVFEVSGEPMLILAAAEMQDPGNLGTLIRAADAFGASGFVALSGTVSPYNSKAVRASAGSLFHLPVVDKVPPADLIRICSKRGVKLLAAAAHAATDSPEAPWQDPVCLVIGQEAAGVPRALQRAAHTTVAIPMQRPIDSLNAGVAGAILLYEAARRRSADSHVPV